MEYAGAIHLRIPGIAGFTRLAGIAGLTGLAGIASRSGHAETPEPSGCPGSHEHPCAIFERAMHRSPTAPLAQEEETVQPLRGTLLTRLGLAVVICAACMFAALAGAPRAYAEDEDFVLLADTHFGQPFQDSYGDAQRALQWAAGFKNLKAVCLAGDVTDRGGVDSYGEWVYLCDAIVGNATRIQALGNHDTGNDGTYTEGFPELTVENGLQHFKEINGGKLTTYHEFENVNVITLGGVLAEGYSVITNSMLRQLNTRLLKTMRQGKMAIVVCHYAYDSGGLNMRKKVRGILRSYPNVLYVSGHRHTYDANDQCKMVTPACTTTPFGRTGFRRSTKYPFRSIGVNACSTYRSGSYSYADSLHVTDGGVMTLRKWNITNGHVDRTWKFTQAKSSVTLRSFPSSTDYPLSSEITYRVTFSDGGTYGGVKSGSTFSLKMGEPKRFSGIPAGVLVKVRMISSAPGWSMPKAKALEVGTRPTTMIFTTRPKQATPEIVSEFIKP